MKKGNRSTQSGKASDLLNSRQFDPNGIASYGSKPK
jgi:hypothetical protein